MRADIFMAAMLLLNDTAHERVAFPFLNTLYLRSSQYFWCILHQIASHPNESA